MDLQDHAMRRQRGAPVYSILDECIYDSYVFLPVYLRISLRLFECCYYEQMYWFLNLIIVFSSNINAYMIHVPVHEYVNYLWIVVVSFLNSPTQDNTTQDSQYGRG